MSQHQGCIFLMRSSYQLPCSSIFLKEGSLIWIFNCDLSTSIKEEDVERSCPMYCVFVNNCFWSHVKASIGCYYGCD
uniref:Uncharacterized protein n=1 Tax=Physcomitrium patens TaxID=3218 RepID=A0A7I4BBL1_PHYPA